MDLDQELKLSCNLTGYGGVEELTDYDCNYFDDRVEGEVLVHHNYDVSEMATDEQVGIKWDRFEDKMFNAIPDKVDEIMKRRGYRKLDTCEGNDGGGLYYWIDRYVPA